MSLRWLGKLKGDAGREKLGQASQERRRGNALQGDLLKPSHGERLVFDGPDDDFLPEPKLRKLGQALFIQPEITAPRPDPQPQHTTRLKYESRSACEASSRAGEAGRLPSPGRAGADKQGTNRASWCAGLLSGSRRDAPTQECKCTGVGSWAEVPGSGQETSTATQKLETRRQTSGCWEGVHIFQSHSGSKSAPW